MSGSPAIIAHRGSACDHPENTLSAFAAAIAAGADAVELDVQIAACGTPMVIHDALLERTTGQPGLVQELTAAEIGAYSAHEPDRFGQAFLGEPIPSLATACHFLAKHDGLLVFIEIKEETLRRHALPAIMQRVAEDSAILGNNRVVISFVDEAIQVAGSLYGLRVGWVLPAFDPGTIARARTLAPEFLFCDRQRLPEGNAPLPSGCWNWAVYEVTDADEALDLAARGVNWIETMTPAALRRGLAQP